MANRIVLNTVSYHGAGAINEIAKELGARGYKKAFICTDPDLIRFGVVKKVLDIEKCSRHLFWREFLPRI